MSVFYTPTIIRSSEIFYFPSKRIIIAKIIEILFGGEKITEKPNIFHKSGRKRLNQSIVFNITFGLLKS